MADKKKITGADIRKAREERNKKYAQTEAQKEFDSIQSYLQSGSDAISKAYGGWNSQEDMDLYKSTLSDAYKRVSDFNTKYGNLYEGFGDLTNNFSNALNNMDSAKSMYSQYITADAYNKDILRTPEKSDYEKLYESIAESDDLEDRAYRARSNADSRGKLFKRKYGLDKIDQMDSMDQDIAYAAMDKYGYGSKEFEQFINDMTMNASKKEFDKVAEGYQDLVRDNKLVKGLAVASPLGQVLLNPFIAAQKVGSLVGGKEFDPYTGAAGVSNLINSGNEEISREITDATPNANLFGVNVPAFLYNSVYVSGIQSKLGALQFGAGYTPLMGASAYNSTLKEGLERGLDRKHAEATALLAGMAEAIAEYTTAGKFENIDSVGGLKDALQNMAKQFWNEGLEEVLTDGANFLTDKFINKSKSEYEQNVQDYIRRGYTEDEARHLAKLDLISQFTQSFIGGGLTGGISAIGASIGDYNANKSLGKEMNRAEFADTMGQYGELNPNSKYFKQYAELANQFGNDLSGVNSDADYARVSAIARNALYESSENGKENSLYNPVTKSLSNQVDNAYTSVQLKRALKDAGIEISDDIEQSNIEEETEVNKKQTKAEQIEEALSKAEETTDSEGSQIKIDEVIHENGKLMVKTDEGEVLPASEVTFSEDDAKLVAEASTMSKADADALLQGYDGQNVDEYIKDFKAVTEGAEAKTDVSSIATTSLSESQKTELYANTRESISRELRAIQRTGEQVAKQAEGNTRAGNFDTKEVDIQSLNRTQRLYVEAFKVISQVTGMNIKLVNNVSTKETGAVENGEYSYETDTVTINLSANHYSMEGADYGYVMSTASHEFTHWMRAKAGDSFSILKNAVKAELGDKWNTYVAEEAKKLSGEDIQDRAEEEVVARACEDMLNDGKYAEKILSNIDEKGLKKLYSAVREFFKKIINSLNSLLDTYESESDVAKEIKSIEGAFERIQDAYLQVLDTAIKNNKNTTTESKVETKTETKTEVKEETKTEVKEETKVETKEDVKEEETEAEEAEAEEETETVNEETEEVKAEESKEEVSFKTPEEKWQSYYDRASEGEADFQKAEDLTFKMMFEGYELTEEEKKWYDDYYKSLELASKEMKAELGASFDKLSISAQNAIEQVRAKEIREASTVKSIQEEGKDNKLSKFAKDSGITNFTTSESGDFVMASSEDGSKTMYNLQTLKSHEVQIRNALKKMGKADQADRIISMLKQQADMLTLASQEEDYTKMIATMNAELTVSDTGKVILHSFVKNGEYPINIDFSTICKKREAYMGVISKLIENGTFESTIIDGKSIAKINEMLKKEGFETACLGCFVESRRLQIQTWAKTFCDEWNDAVRKVNPNATPFGFSKGDRGKTLLTETEISNIESELSKGKKNKTGGQNLGQGAVSEKMERLLQRSPSLAHTIGTADLLTPDGLASLRGYKDIYSLLLGRYGSNTPKPVQDFNPYNGEFAELTGKYITSIFGDGIKGLDGYRKSYKKEHPFTEKKPSKKASDEQKKAYNEAKKQYEYDVETNAIREYLFDIGGARVQSFSDFLIENTLDYFQMVADLSAREFPMHAYTKEIVFARIFGMTGMKINMSLIADVDTSVGDNFIGLTKTKDGYDFQWGDKERNKATNNESYIQSIGFKDALALILDKRYSANTGTIAVGVSIGHIVKCLESSYIRMCIPYHSSGMNAIFAKLMNIDRYTDFTNYQNTTIEGFYDSNGKRIEYNGGGDIQVGKAVVKSFGDFEFNKALRTMNPEEAVKAYLNWCNEMHPTNTDGVFYKCTPKFDIEIPTDVKEAFGINYGRLTESPNYYKLIEDFNLYDTVTGEYARQTSLDTTYAEEGLSGDELEEYKKRLRDSGYFTEKEVEKYAETASKNYMEVIRDEISDRAKYHKVQDAKMDKTIEDISSELKVMKSSQLEKNSTESEISDIIINNGFANNEEEAKNAAKVIKSFIDRAESNDRRFGAHYLQGGDRRTIALGIANDLVKRGRIKFRGLKISSDSEIAASQIAGYAMMLRSPSFETFRLIYTKGNVVVGDDAISLKLPAETTTKLTATYEEEYERISERMKKLGADGFYMMHNHPSGRITPSPKDFEITKKYVENVKGYRGHIVMDHNKFTLIDENSNAVEHSVAISFSKDYKQPVINHPLLYKVINNVDVLGETAQSLVHDKNYSVVIYCNSGGEVMTIEEIHNNFIKSKMFERYLINRKRDFGSPTTFVSTSDNDIYMHIGSDFLRRNLCTDVVDENTWSSLLKRGIRPIPGFLSNGDVYAMPYKVNEATLFSKQVERPYDDVTGSRKSLERANEKLTDDVARLRKLLRLQGKVTKGKVLNDHQLEVAARAILKGAKSKYKTEAMIGELQEIYGYILDNYDRDESKFNMDIIMSKCMDAASRVMNESGKAKVEQRYPKEVLAKIDSMSIKVGKRSELMLKLRYGDDWQTEVKKHIKISDKGITMKEAWDTLHEEYPLLFGEYGKHTSMLTLIDRREDLKDSLKITRDSVRRDAELEVAEDIYSKFWNVSSIVTVADKYDAEIKSLKAKHKKTIIALKEDIESVRAEGKKAVADAKAEGKTAVEKQRLADTMYYNHIIQKLREQKDAKIQDVKEYYKDKEANQKEMAERRRLIGKISGTSKEMLKWMNHPDVKKGKLVPDALKKPVSDLLRAIDFSSKRALGMTWGENGGVPTKKDLSFIKAVEDMYDVILSIENRQTEDFGLDLPPQFAEDWRALSKTLRKNAEIAQNENYVLNAMTSEELDSLDKMVTATVKAIKEANKIIIKKNKVHVATIAQSTIRLEDKYGAKSVSKNKAITRVGQFFQFDNLLPVYAFKMMGSGAKSVFDEIRNGWCKYAFNIRDIETYVKTGNKGKAIYTGKDVEKWDNTTHNFEVLMRDKKGNATGEKKTVTLTESQMMSLYCLAKRDQAKKHLMHKGFVVNDINSKDQKKTIIQADNVPLTETELEKIISMVENNAKMKDVADRLQEFMNTTCSDWGNEITMARFGITAFGEKNYFPIKVAPTELDADVKDNTKSLYGLLNMSFTKPLTTRASNAILLESIFDVFENHTEEMAKYNSLALPLLNALKWWNYSEENSDETKKSVRASLKTVFGAQMNSYIYNFLTDINGQQERGRGEDIPKAMLKHYKIAAVAGNIQVALLQPVSYMRAALSIKGRYLATSYNPWDIKHGIEMKNKYSGLAVWKDMGFFDVNIGRGLDKLIKQDKKFSDKVTDATLFGAELFDDITWGALWTACEKQIKAERNLKGDELIEATTEMFNEMVMRTQVFDSTISRSSNMRSNSFETQVLTAFMSEPTIGYNTLLETVAQFALDERKGGFKDAFKKNGKPFLKAVVVYSLSAALESVVRTAVAKFRTPEDDDEDIEDVWKEFLGYFTQNVNPLNNLPIIKDIISIADNYSPKRMEYEAFETMKRAFKYYDNMIEDGEVNYKAVYTMLQALSQLSGLPMSGTLKSVIDMWNGTVGRMYEGLIVR